MSKENDIPLPRDQLVKRLKRLEGQIRGIKKMISEERDFVSIVVQLAAVRSGVEGGGTLELNNCMKPCPCEKPDADINIDMLTW